MLCLVTGVAGFIGSHLAERLIRQGDDVVGLDSFVPYYPRAIKQTNLAGLVGSPHFTFYEHDLRTADLSETLAGVDVVFHLAAMAGLTKSWTEFESYMTCNLLGTQRLLEACRGRPLRAFVHASTSSVYGAVATGDEHIPLNPISPYGVTKLAAERLALAYQAEFAVPTVVLRYFSVYGPRQRPDMGYNIFIRSVLRGEPIVVFGDGEQTRGNTFVADCVDATLLAAERGRPGDVFNVGGGEARSVRWVIETIEELVGQRAHVQYGPPRAGDQANTLADTTRARAELGFEPHTSLREGLAVQVAWQRAAVET